VFFLSTGLTSRASYPDIFSTFATLETSSSNFSRVEALDILIIIKRDINMNGANAVINKLKRQPVEMKQLIHQQRNKSYRK
jgi:hypothetical protein